MEAEHRIDIKHRVDIERINKEVREFPPLHPECRIYRVHDGLRKAKPEAYEPMLVSIGPYHLQNPKLQAMRKHKLRYLYLLLERRQEESVERYILELEKLEDTARKCYADQIDVDSSDKFVEMMLLDGCFIIEFFRRISRKVVIDYDDPIFNVDWMVYQIGRDMVLLENQLPYFVVSKLFDMTKLSDSEEPFIETSMRRLVHVLPFPIPISSFLSRIDGHEAKHAHLLHLLHTICYPSSEPTSSQKDSDKYIHQMGSVVELQEAGVKFKKLDMSTANNDDVSSLHVKFDNGLMEIPCIMIQDSTESILRNLIAYEQHSPDIDRKLTAFLWFMDELINSENDVKLLRNRGIIDNLLGDDKAVSDLFKKLGDGVIQYPGSQLHYLQIRQKVNTHCDTPWNQMMAKLKHDYFNTPWAGVSTIAASVLLTLTLLQTFPVLKSPSTWFK